MLPVFGVPAAGEPFRGDPRTRRCLLDGGDAVVSDLLATSFIAGAPAVWLSTASQLAKWEHRKGRRYCFNRLMKNERHRTRGYLCESRGDDSFS